MAREDHDPFRVIGYTLSFPNAMEANKQMTEQMWLASHPPSVVSAGWAWLAGYWRAALGGLS